MPLLLQARGLIVERGSMLSHAAIIARELGLPAIVGVPGAIARLRDGDLVEMDGATGRIAIRGRG
jgi:pyruvate,water dikinase